MSIVFNKNNPIVGKDGIGAVIDLIKNNSNGIDGIAQSLGEIGDDIDSLDDRIETLENDSESLTHRVTVVEADLQTVNDDMRDKADVSTVNALTERVSTVEAEVQDRPDYSEFNPVANDVQTLNDSYDNIVNTLNQEINELIDGKAMIASALTDRGYPTQATDSSASMAQKIEDMAYDAGWLAQLGYDEDLDGGFKAEVRRVKEIQDALRNGALTTLRNRTDIYFINPGQLPDTTSMQYFLSGATNLRFVGEIVTNTTDFAYFHYEGTTAIERIDRIVSPNATYWHRSLSNIKSIGYVDFTSAVTLTAVFYSGNNQIFIEIHNLGKAPACTSAQLNGSSVWGAGSEENRQSLVDSLLTYSFDRAAAGYSTCTITLHAGTLARLTQEEIAAITAKGFTLTS